MHTVHFINTEDTCQVDDEFIDLLPERLHELLECDGRRKIDINEPILYVNCFDDSDNPAMINISNISYIE